jgi:hypothetical protein
VVVVNIGPIGGGSILVIYDRYGNIYIAPSLQLGKSWEGGDIQISGGWVGSPYDSTMPDPANLTQFLSGLSFSAGGGIIGGGNVIWSPFAGKYVPNISWEAGAHLPYDLGVGVAYSLWVQESWYKIINFLR